MASSPLFLSDWREARPADACARERRRDRWRLWDYTLEDGRTGTLLFAGQDEKLPPLRLRLPARGRYRVHLGVMVDCGLGDWTAPCLKVKLERDPCYTELTTAGPHWWPDVRDVYWRETDLDGDDLVIAKAAAFKGGLAYARLVPVASPTPAPPDTPHLVVTNDSYCAYDSVDELWEKIFPFRGTAVRKLLFCFAQGDCCFYFDTKVGTRLRDLPFGDWSFPRALDRLFFEKIAALARAEDVLGRTAAFTRALGIAFHASVRLEAFALHPPFDHFTTRFYEDHPAWRCRDADGRPIARMSYAVPEVRAHMLALFEEFLHSDVDGLNLIFTRGMPMLLYEDAALAGLKSAAGVDGRALAEDDPAWLAYRADTLTGFMREVKALVERAAAAKGRRLELTAVVPANGAVNRFYGLDVQRWAAEGLVDELYPDPSLENAAHDEKPDNIDRAYYAEATRGTACRWAPRLMPYQSIAPYHTGGWRGKLAETFAAVEREGASGMMLWDGAHTFLQNPEAWERVKNFGAFAPERLPTLAAFRDLGGFTMDRYPSHMCF